MSDFFTSFLGIVTICILVLVVPLGLWMLLLLPTYPEKRRVGQFFKAHWVQQVKRAQKNEAAQ